MPVSGIRWGAVLARKGRGGFFLCPFRGRGAWENEDIAYLCRDDFISI